MNVLFVCTGNTCRSPMAEALLKEKAPHINVQSAGIFAQPNDGANKHAIQTMKEKDIQLVHSAQSVTKKILQWADLVLTMTTAHKTLLLNQYPRYEQKYYTLKEYTATKGLGGDEVNIDKDIIDPFGGDLFLYKQTVIEIEKYIDVFIEKLDADAGGKKDEN